MIRRLRLFGRLDDLDLPVVLLIGGATGTGKSTVATEIAYRLGITRVTSTDFVRQTMRAFFSQDFMPAIHYSSFEAGASQDEDDEDRVLRRLPCPDPQRARRRASRDRTRVMQEGWSMVLEGVHLVPGMVSADIEGALVVQFVLAIDDVEAHASHFWLRDSASRQRASVRAVSRLASDDIREIRTTSSGGREKARRARDREQQHRGWRSRRQWSSCSRAPSSSRESDDGDRIDPAARGLGTRSSALLPL